ncbi:unnamed protein product [Durusdinium trenchii]|uniref:Uncharacterized protein n=1 Tax=Durusdinium trenchii TaxID=1381693 RepID=A0ABP0JID7_9DINO
MKILWALLAMVLGANGMTCPGSNSLIHASAQVVAIAGSSCKDVHEEILARVQSKWHDPHNGGTYSLVSATALQLQLKRLTGDKKYTDKMTITLSDTNGKCMIMGCSESQVFSIGDKSTNFCNLHNLYCGSAGGCQPVKHDFAVSETKIDTSIGAGSNRQVCLGPVFQ